MSNQAFNPIRKKLGEAFGNSRSVRAFEDLFENVTQLTSDLAIANDTITALQNQLNATQTQLNNLINSLNNKAIDFVDVETLIKSTSALNNHSGALSATLTNAPVSGNPTKWVRINDGGTIRHMALW